MEITKKNQKRIALTVIVASILLIAVYPFYSIRYTDSRTNCFPYKLWLIDKRDRNPVSGDFIVFRTPENAASYIPDYKIWVKKVFAAGRGRVDVMPAVPGEFASIKMNGMDKKLPVRARVTVDGDGSHAVFTVFAADSMGRPLSVIKSQNIPPGYYYAYSPADNSYDSRYWGLVSKDEILGTAYPIF